LNDGLRQVHGDQGWGWFVGPACAGGSGGDADTGEIGSHDKRLAVDAGQGDGREVRTAGYCTADDLSIDSRGCCQAKKFVFKVIPKRGKSFGFGLLAADGKANGDTTTGDQCDRLGAAALGELLTAWKQRSELGAWLRDQAANAPRPTEFMGAETETRTAE
jgi:hypothetical protein